MFKKKHLKIIFLILAIILLIFLIVIISNRFINKSIFANEMNSFAQKNEKTIFSINECIFFSSCDVKNRTNSSTTFTIENLYQYTDIALFLNNNSDNFTLENTLKNVKINNINFYTSPSLGTPGLYYKNLNHFAQSDIIDNNLISDELNFNISSDDNTSLDTPTLYNNCANPIVLSYINQNIKSDYTITDTSKSITYDGSLLKTCGILLNSINCSLSFDIYITNNLNQEFKCTVYLNIPLEESSNSIYNGSVTLKQNTNYKFYRYK